MNYEFHFQTMIMNLVGKIETLQIKVNNCANYMNLTENGVKQKIDNNNAILNNQFEIRINNLNKSKYLKECRILLN